MIVILISLVLAIAIGSFCLVHSVEKLCQRIDRLAKAWESDDDDPSDDWKKEKV